MTQVLNKSLFHNKCVCQICTCHKHKCPHCDPELPFQGSSTYKKDYHKHPFDPYKMPKEKEPDLDRHYDYINSKYREDYPGHNCGPLEKHGPKPQQKVDLPFHGTSDYRSNFGPKKVALEKPFNKDKHGYAPGGPFDGTTTYKSDYLKKSTNPHSKKKPQVVQFPPGYKFNGDTTYKSDFIEKPLDKLGSYKPKQGLRQTGPHDLQTTYKGDYVDKQLPTKCPILNLPQYKGSINAPYSHYGYDATRNHWFEKS